MSKLYGRTRARCQAMELLYQAEVSGVSALDLVETHTYLLTKGPLHEYTKPLLHQYYEHEAQVNEAIQAHLTGWDMNRLYAVDRALLRMSVTELLVQDADTPISVIIDEAVEIAKVYGQDGSPRFINGVLGGVAREVHPSITDQDLKTMPQVINAPSAPLVVTKDDTIVWPADDEQAFEVWECEQDD